MITPTAAAVIPPSLNPVASQTAAQPATIPPTFTAAPFPTPTLAAGVAPTGIPTPCPPGVVRTGVFPSQFTGESNYRIYLPPCYGLDGRAYPVLYLFGGNSQDDSAWDNYGLDEAAEAAIQQRLIPPLLLVMVDGGWIANTTSGGPNSYEAHILNYLIPFIEQNYCVWRKADGRAIGGLSRGGYWALEIAFRHPEQFASVGGHSAALIDSFAGPEINPQYTGLSNDLGDLRIYLDIGDQDYLRPNTEQLHNDMTAQGIPHTWVLNEGAHEDSYWPQHLAEYLLWYAEPWPLDRGEYPTAVCPQRVIE
jgi:enterochelin esterase-like enzyme